MGFVAWAVLFAAVIVVEALGLTLRGHQWPTLSDIFRVAMRPEWSRWLLFALWLWAGWHFFIRGWTFFLRGPGARQPKNSLGGGKSFTQIVQQVIVPLAVFYAVLVGPVMIAWQARRRGDWPDRPEPHAGVRAARAHPRAFAWHVVVTMTCGYMIFACAMGLYELIAGHPAAGIFAAAAREGALLAFAIALPAFALLTVAEFVATRRSRDHA
ncbi:MAG: DUF6186 family protein [Acidimicrobiia bacterium]